MPCEPLFESQCPSVFMPLDALLQDCWWWRRWRVRLRQQLKITAELLHCNVQSI